MRLIEAITLADRIAGLFGGEGAIGTHLLWRLERFAANHDDAAVLDRYAAMRNGLDCEDAIVHGNADRWYPMAVDQL
jgi:hypothetical protein